MGHAPTKPSYQAAYSITSRVIAAVICGYVLANLVAVIFTHLLPMSQPEGVMTAMLSSFAVYTGAVMWVFSTKTSTKAWIGLAIPSLVCAVWVFVLQPEIFL